MRVAVEPVLLACCAVEAATALALQPDLDGVEWVSGSDARDVTVVVIAGTVTQGNRERVQQVVDAAPEPRAVVAFGVCASSGGPYWDSHAVVRGWQEADLFVPGCPPPPSVFWTSVTRAAREAVAHATR